MTLLKKHLKTLEIEKQDSFDISEIDPESIQVSKVLPDDLYKKVANIVGLDVNVKEKLYLAKRKNYKRLYKGVCNISRALQTVTVEKNTTEEYYSDSSVEPPSPRVKQNDPNTNLYFDFFAKTVREQITWESNYLPPETEMEKGLIRRADDLTNKICSEFCTYMRNLGGYDSPLFQEETVKELFQIEFNTHLVKSLEICSKEMVSVPGQVAISSKYPEAQEKEMLKRKIIQDIISENKPSNKIAFGKNLPKNMQWRPPSNKTESQWKKTKNIPEKVSTMENVWGDITKLKCVQDFCQWIIDHPDGKSPIFLKNSGMLHRENLKKIRNINKYDKRNKLPKIDLKKQLINKSDHKISLPPENINISLLEIDEKLKNIL